MTGTIEGQLAICHAVCSGSLGQHGRNTATMNAFPQCSPHPQHSVNHPAITKTVGDGDRFPR